MTTDEALKPVWELCNKFKVTKTQLALSYVLSHPEISTVIPGIRTPQHVEQNTTGLIKIDDEDLTMIEGFGSSNFVDVMQLIRQQG
jgi:aryl-alcohol dehydrogenase-like predicted oxidoreductase